MRLIDAEALKVAIPETRVSVFENCHECTLLDAEQVKELIDDAPTIEALKEQQPKWIPVDEKKPKSMANKVLVYLDHEDLVGYIGFGHYEKFQGEEMWYDLEHNEQFSKRGYTVTHWMPLPEPPKDETH